MRVGGRCDSPSTGGGAALADQSPVHSKDKALAFGFHFFCARSAVSLRSHLSSAGPGAVVALFSQSKDPDLYIP